MRNTLLMLALVVALPSSSFATTIAVIDSGTDLLHEQLKNKKWDNVDEVRGNETDDDGNGKVDDFNGWNFAEDNNQIIDYSYLGTFSPDCYKFFEVQLKIFNGTATDEDRQWLEEKRSDAEFIAQLQKFGNFIHGTHVAGITAKDTDKAQIMGVKLIPTEVKKPFEETVAAKAATMGIAASSEDDGEIDMLKDMLIKAGLDKLAEMQGKGLEPIGLYVWYEKARVANCSFGTSVHAVKPLIAQLLQMIIQREPTDEEAEKYAAYFVGRIIEYGKQFAIDAQETFFVMAAGNDGTNNDELPTYPANIKRKNTLSVAASFGYSRLASFSNYGEYMVDVAAPGVGIKSSIPGHEYLTVSGTSQAAPFVANIVGRLFDINPALTFAQVKTIVLGTVDKKDFLAGKVASEGIANAARAIRAAELSVKGSVAVAVMQALREVPDVEVTTHELIQSRLEGGNDSGMLIQMPSLFKL